jgi:hypothetical protein
VTFTQTLFADVYVGLMPMFEAHWKEMARDGPLELDVIGYCRLEQAGLYQFFVAKAPDIIAYAGFATMPRGLHQAHRVAQSTMFYAAPIARDGKVMRGLIRYAEGVLRVDGPVEVVLDFPDGDRGVALLCASMGYTPLSRSRRKWLS